MKKLGLIVLVLFLWGCSGQETEVNVSQPQPNQELMNSAFNTSQLSLTIKESK